MDKPIPTDTDIVNISSDTDIVSVLVQPYYLYRDITNLNARRHFL